MEDTADWISFRGSVASTGLLHFVIALLHGGTCAMKGSVYLLWDEKEC